MDHKLLPDFGILSFCSEVRENKGEDCWCYGFSGQAGLLAVFDGCGGSGARHREKYEGRSDAFVASRLAAGSVYSWLQNASAETLAEPAAAVSDLQKHLQDTFDREKPEDANDGTKGFLTLPTTMAAALIQGGEDTIQISSIHAGDSRVYVLTNRGLSQLSRDDSNQPDPQEDLYDEGGITNLICCDEPVQLRLKTVTAAKPCLVITATDGCFGYVSTPMEFEAMILHTLLESDSVAAWEKNLRALIGTSAGDDYTLCMAGFGFGSFSQLQDTFRARYEHLNKTYLTAIWAAPWEDRELRRSLWQDYRKEYMKYMEGDDI